MRVDLTQTKPDGSQLIITNIVSFTLLLSSVVILGAICRFFKRCCKKLVGRRHPQHDVIKFTPITKLPLRQCSSISKQSRQKIRHLSEMPYSTEEVTVQPDDLSELIATRPRAPTYPTGHLSAPVVHEQRFSIIGWTSQPEITVFDLDPTIYKKERSLQKFQSSVKRKCGILDTEVYFDASASELKVRINRIQHLPIKDYAITTGTYVLVKNLPDPDTQRTLIRANCIDPVFNEDFSFQVSAEDEVSSHVLVFELQHTDELSTSFVRATARLPLFHIDLLLRRRLVIPFIESRRSFFSALHPVYTANATGCVLLSLQHQPDKDIIVVNPIRVCNIPAKKHGGGQDVFVKVMLRHRGTRIAKVKTQTNRMKRMPRYRHYYQATFDEPLTLALNSKPVQDCEIRISLNYYLFFKSSFIMGQLKLSVDEPDYEATHYQNMIDSPGERISTWYEMQSFFTD